VIIVQAPLRISFFGGGTDFPNYYLAEGGCALSSTINKYIYIVIKPRYDSIIRICYTQTEMVDDVNHIQHELIREALKKTNIHSGVEITTMGDIPAGSGLGSSSTVTVGALCAMYAYNGESVTAERLSRESCEIEIDTLGKPIGVQDQYIAAYGGLRFFEFKRYGDITNTKISLDPTIFQRFNENLILFFSGLTRRSETVLDEQNMNVNHNFRVLRKMKEIAYTAKEEFSKGNIDEIGNLLHESWLLKKQLAANISNDQIDEWYSIAMRAGALGGKITGAGGGGFLLLYVPQEKRRVVQSALSHLKELPFHLEQDGTKVIFNYRPC